MRVDLNDIAGLRSLDIPRCIEQTFVSMLKFAASPPRVERSRIADRPRHDRTAAS